MEYAIALCKTTPTTLNYRKKEFSRINEDNAKNLQEVLDNNTLKSKLGVDIESLEEDGAKLRLISPITRTKVLIACCMPSAVLPL